ncbi:MAG TPA: multiheme c-type cytochrome [Planctomycetota bacterium]|nr:multiheme c-type cytochrome [Planctomycetota bacterium]
MGSSGKLLFAVCVVAGAAMAGLEAVGPRTASAREILIIATGDIRARVRRCGCQGEGNHQTLPELTLQASGCGCSEKNKKNAGKKVLIDLGAFPERSAFQDAVGGDPLVVDSGDLFFPHLDPLPHERAEWKLRAKLLADLSGKLGLRVLGLGELDLALGRQDLEEVARGAPFEVVSANLVDAKTRTPAFKTRAVVRTKGGVKVGVTSVLAPPPSDALTSLLEREGLALADPAAALRGEVDALRSEGCELVVLLAHAPDVRARAIVREVGRVDLVVEAHREVPSTATTFVDGGTAFSAPYPGGGTPLRITVKVVPGAMGVVDGSALIEARSWVDKLGRELEAQKTERLTASDERRRYLDTQIPFVQEQLDKWTAQLPQAPRHEVTAIGIMLHAVNWKKNQRKDVLAAIDRFKDDMDKIELPAGQAAELEMPGKLPTGLPRAYATEAACATCHRAQTEIWTKSKHARAWADLEKSGSQKDPECVRCHSIGFREAGGFAEPKRGVHDGLDYRNVQCEACHGPRVGHPQSPGVGLPLPGYDRCTKCHDQEHDPSFDAKKFDEALHAPGKLVCVRGIPH